MVAVHGKSSGMFRFSNARFRMQVCVWVGGGDEKLFFAQPWAVDCSVNGYSVFAIVVVVVVVVADILKIRSLVNFYLFFYTVVKK